MFDFLKRKKNSDTLEKVEKPEQPLTSAQEEATNKSVGFFARLKQGLAKTRATFSTGMANLFLGKKELKQELLNEIEMALLTADVGVETTDQLIQTLTKKLARKELNDAQAAFLCLQEEMKKILRPCALPLSIASEI